MNLSVRAACGSRLALWQGHGVAFCAAWAAAILTFPLQKQMIAGYIPVAVGLLAGGVLCRQVVRVRLTKAIMLQSTPAFLAAAVILATAVRAIPLMLYSQTIASDAAIYHIRAVDLLSGNGYGPTAFQPPGLPMLLACWYAITDPQPMWGFIFSGLASIAAVLVAYDLGRRAVSESAGRWAAVMLAVMPTVVFTSTDIHTSSLQLLAFLACGDLTVLALQSGRRGWIATICLGLVLGAGTLAKPVLLLGPAVVLGAWLAMGAGWKCAARLAVCVFVMAACVLPWTVRNYRLFGEPVLVSTNGGSVLYHGTNWRSNGMWADFPPPPPGGWGNEAVRDRTLRKMAVDQAVSHPLEFAYLVIRKQPLMWGTSSTNIAMRLRTDLPPGVRWAASAGIKALVNAGWAALCVLCFASSVKTRVWSNPRLRAMVLLLLLTALLHLLYEVQSRYHIPVIPSLVLIAAAGLARTEGAESEISRQ